jgi:hypothetical protein
MIDSTRLIVESNIPGGHVAAAGDGVRALLNGNPSVVDLPRNWCNRANSSDSFEKSLSAMSTQTAEGSKLANQPWSPTSYLE